MKKFYLTISMALLIAVLSVLTVAEPEEVKGKRGNRPRPAASPARMQKRLYLSNSYRVGMILRLKEQLDLSDKQIELLKAVNDDVKGQLGICGKAIKAQRDALQKAIESGAAESVLRTTASDLGTAIGDQAVLKVKIKSKIDEILTKTQQTKLEELKKSRKKPAPEQFGKDKPKKTGEGPKGSPMRGKPADIEVVFDRIDTDGDGVINPEELAAHMERMKERRNSERPRTRGRTGRQKPVEKPED